MAPEPKEEEVPKAVSSPTLSRAGSCLSSHSLTPSELEDRQAERALKLQLATLALRERKLAMTTGVKNASAAAELDLEEKRVSSALKEKKAGLEHARGLK